MSVAINSSVESPDKGKFDAEYDEISRDEDGYRAGDDFYCADPYSYCFLTFN